MENRATKAKTNSSAKSKRRPTYWFDKVAADRAVRFIERYIRHIKGEWAGQHVDLETWERKFIRDLFGWKRTADNLRRYRVAFLAVARKNGKSFLGACIAVYLLFCDHEPGAEIYSAAADREQAALIFDVAKQMIEAEPALAKRCEMYRRSVVVGSTASVYRVLSSDAPTKHGLNPHGIIFDELHAQPNRDLFDTLETGTGARRQPIILIMTTAGYDRESICYEKWKYALAVRDGIIRDDSFLPVIFSADPEDDWLSPKTWKKANPNLGISPKIRYLRAQCAEAQEQPAKENTFRRLHLNQWTEQAVRWMPMDKWDACATPVFGPDDLAGDECFAALDLASTGDIASLGLVFPPNDERDLWALLWRFWVPAETARQRSRRDAVKYTDWIREGYLTATPGEQIDYAYIRRDINLLKESFNIREIAFDRWNATQLTQELDGDGFEMVAFGQGFASMSAPMRELMKLVLSRKIAHAGHPVARWMANNVAAKQDPAGNLKPDKSKSLDKIDGIVTAIMGIGRGTLKLSGPSIYESQDLEAF